MGLISWIVVGFLAGMLGRWMAPGTEPGGFVVAALVGVAGASFGGFAVGVLGGTGATGFGLWSIPAAALGAATLLFLYGLISRSTA
ncbi:hypothetical protein BH23ACT11_BH23ACT11_08380 [soil metagenome]